MGGGGGGARRGCGGRGGGVVVRGEVRRGGPNFSAHNQRCS